jgi:putative membrane protein
MKFHAMTLVSVTALALASLPACQDRPGTTTTTGATVTTMNDAQILEVIHAANEGEIAQARLAQQRATDPRVQRFAAMMIADHTDADQQVSELASKDGLVMSVSAASGAIQTSGAQAGDDLLGKTGAAFDAAYVETQINEHQALLDTIDRTLTTNATKDDVRGLLHTVRARVAEHLEHAKRVESQLPSG